MKTAPGNVCTSSRLGTASSSSSALYGCSPRAEDRAGKHRLENGEEEMQACFARLMQLVPTIPPNGKMSKVQLLQHVIDYILDLEHTLDFRPSDLLHQSGKVDEDSEWGVIVSNSNGSITPSSPPQQVMDRKPLTENVQVNSIAQSSVLQTSSITRRP